MARFQNRSTRVHDTMTTEFRAQLKDMPKKRVPAPMTEYTDTRHNPVRKALADAGIKMRTLQKRAV